MQDDLPCVLRKRATSGVTLNVSGAGEVTLTGRVLPIGGVKEKLLAARRSGVKTVLFPEGNRKDYAELSGMSRVCCNGCTHCVLCASSR